MIFQPLGLMKIYNFIVENTPELKREARFANKCNQLNISSKDFFELCRHIFTYDDPKDIRRALPMMVCQSIVILDIYNNSYRKKGNKAKRLTGEIWLEIHNRNKNFTVEHILENLKI